MAYDRSGCVRLAHPPEPTPGTQKPWSQRLMLIKSPILSALSGSIGGATAAKNRGGTYFRSRVVPLNPQTTAQFEVRGNMAAAASAWSGLTDAQRTAWTDYAASLDGTNAVGDTKRLSGINAFTAANSLRLLAGQAQLTAAPTSNGRATLTPPTGNPTIVLGDGEATIDITLTDSWAATQNGVLFFYYSRPVSDGTSFYKGPWTFGGKQIRGVGAPSDPLVLSLDTVIGLNTTAKFFYRIRSMDSLGRLSPEIRGVMGAIT